MRILAIYQHYWPDSTPYAHILRAILESAVQDGYSAAVYTAQPGYNDIKQPRRPSYERLNGVEIYRQTLLPQRKTSDLLRLLNYAYYLTRALVHVLLRRNRYDLILANSHPPILIGLGLRIIQAITGIKYILHYQDIHPEAATLTRRLPKNLLTEFARKIDAASSAQAAYAVTLSMDMHDTLQARAPRRLTNLQVINNFALAPAYPASTLPLVYNEPSSVFRVLFAGNIGGFQCLGRLIDAARVLRTNYSVQFIFMGAGACRDALIERAADLVGHTVFFIPFQSLEIAFGCMQKSDLGVVSICSGMHRVAYPSKTMTYLAAGCPVLVIADATSKLANEVISHNLGYVTSCGAPSCIADAIAGAYAERSRWTADARAALVVRSAKVFGRERALSKWSALFYSLSNGESNGTRRASLGGLESQKECIR